jgi:adenine deaminase
MTELEQRLAAARGDQPCDVIVTNARVVNVLSAEVETTTVGVHGGYVVGLGDYQGRTVIDARGDFLVPGFVEGHIHVESTLLPIPEFARTVLPRGTTTAVIDPHEIANVYGLDGIRYMLACAETCPLDIHVMLPSCVPATPFESAGATLTAADLAQLIDHPRVAGIGELMNFPGIINGDGEMLARAALAARSVADGHCPGVTGHALNAYLTAGVATDHESTSAAEAREKLRRGLHVHIREGSAERNLVDLLPIVTPANACNCSLVTDDRHPDELLEHGHLDYAVRLAAAHGLPPIIAIQMATINTARTYRLWRRGAVAPGYLADFFLTASLEECRPSLVFKRGVCVARDGACLVDTGTLPPLPAPAMNVAPLAANAFAVHCAADHIRVIDIVPHQIVTQELIEPAPRGPQSTLASDPRRDLVKIAVVERHHATGRVGVGFVRGLGLRHGAIASTVAHDAHNIIVAGVTDEDMLAAVRAVIDNGGGFATVKNGAVCAAVPLPIAGLMSVQPVQKVVEQHRRLLAATAALGSTLANPFMTLSFLALTPIPALKLTDRGLFDATRFAMTTLAA